MLDRLLEAPAERLLNKWAVLTLQSGMTPNRLTLIGFAFGVAAAIAAGMQAYLLALLLVVLNRLFDGLAGMMARLSNVTALGSYLDIVTDFTFFAGFVFFFSLGVPASALAAALLIFAYLAMAVIWLTAPSVETSRGPVPAASRPLVGNSEICLFMAICCAMPGWFPAVTSMFALLCFTSALVRLITTVRKLKIQ